MAVEGLIDPGQHPLFPAAAHVSWIHGQAIHLILTVCRQLVLCASVVFSVSIDPEVLNQHSVRKAEIWIPQADLAAIQNGGRLLIDEGQPIFVEQCPYLVFPLRFVGCIPAACAS